MGNNGTRLLHPQHVIPNTWHTDADQLFAKNIFYFQREQEHAVYSVDTIHIHIVIYAKNALYSHFSEKTIKAQQQSFSNYSFQRPKKYYF